MVLLQANFLTHFVKDIKVTPPNMYKSLTVGSIRAHFNFIWVIELTILLGSFCRTIPFAWNLITAGYVEQSVYGVYFVFLYTFHYITQTVSFL